MDVSDITNIARVVITIIGVTLVLQQIIQARRSMEADHLRRKKESTFNGYNLIREDFRRINNEILLELDVSQESVLEKHHFDTIRGNNQLSEKVTTLLSYIQRMAVGVQNDVYDLNLLLDLSGTPFIRTFDRYYPYTLESRQRSITFYQEAEYFVNILRGLRENRISEIRSKKI